MATIDLLLWSGGGFGSSTPSGSIFPRSKAGGSGKGGEARSWRWWHQERFKGLAGGLFTQRERTDPTDAAGASADGTTWTRALGLGLDPQASLQDGTGMNNRAKRHHSDAAIALFLDDMEAFQKIKQLGAGG